MTLTDELAAVLQAIVTVSNRVYRRRLPEPFTLPAITFFRVSTGFVYDHDGDSTLQDAYFQVSCWADSHTAAEALAGEVKTALDAWSGGVVLPQNQIDMTDEDTGIWHVVYDVRVFWNS